MSRDNYEIISPGKPLNNDLAEKKVLAMYYYHPDTPTSLLRLDDFYNVKYRKIFSCFIAIQEQGKTPSDTVLFEYIINLPKSDEQGHPTYNPTLEDLLEISDVLEPDAFNNFKENIAILKGYAKLRKARDLFVKGLSSITPGNPFNLDEVLEELIQSAEAIERGSYNEFSSDLIPVTVEDLKEQLNKEGGDLHTGYFFKTDNNPEDSELVIHDRALTFVAAPTSHGKSTMLENLALRILQYHPDKKVLYLTYEEDSTSVITSFLTIYCAMHGALPSKGKIRSTIKEDLKGNERFIASEASKRYNSAKKDFFNLLEKKSLNIRYKDYDIDKLISYVKYMKSNNACDIVVIDYMQLLSLSDSVRLSRQEQLKQICLKLKDLAVSDKYGLPIVLAAQFNREVINPLNLVSTKIREAGDIEQIANTIVAMWNCGFTSQFDKSSTPDQLRLEYNGLENVNPNKIFAKIIKRRGQQPNVKTMFEFDGSTGLITSKENIPSTNNIGEDEPF